MSEPSSVLPLPKGPHVLRLYPARRDPEPGPVILRAPEEDEATCFYQPDRAADHACGFSGRFISELHTVHAGETAYSFDALVSVRQEKQLGPFHDRVVRFDRIAFFISLLSLVPIYGWLAFPLTATGTIVLTVLAMKRRTTVPHNSKAWCIASWVSLALQLLIGITFIVALIA